MLTEIYTIIVFTGILFAIWKRIFRDDCIILPGFKDSVVDNISRKNIIIDRLNQQRQIGSIPPDYPNGWFALLESAELKRGAVVEVQALGLHLVAWRGTSGKAHVSNAFCACGANLAYSSRIDEDLIVCSSHHIRLQDTGGCIQSNTVDMISKTPPKARAGTYIILERNGFLYMWYHAEGLEPHWSPEVHEEIATGRLICRARSQTEVYAHIQDVRENEADFNHFACIHRDGFALGLKQGLPEGSFLKTLDFTHFEFETQWKPDKNKTYQAALDLSQYLYVCGKKIGRFADIRITATGLGIFEMHSKTMLFDLKIIASYTPLGPMRQQVTKHFYCSPWVPSILVLYLMKVVEGNASRDTCIWNRKMFIRNPCLPAEDSTIKLFRRWCSQFYSK